jgi:hypothetical protein
MKISFFSPYYTPLREAALALLVLNYLGRRGAHVVEFRCNGGVLECNRNQTTGGLRNPFECVRCIAEQSAISRWCGAGMSNLSDELGPDDMITTSRWAASVALESFKRVEFRGVNVWEACCSTIISRWNALDLNQLKADQELAIRAIFESYVLMAVASERFLKRFEPDLVFALSSGDVLSEAYLSEARASGVEVVRFGFLVDSGESVVERSLSGDEQVRRYTTGLIVDEPLSLRSDPRSWGAEITAVVHEVLSFLDCAPDRCY